MNERDQRVLTVELYTVEGQTYHRVINRKLWDQAVDQLLACDGIDHDASPAEVETYWPLTDHQGTVRDIYSTTSSGDKAEHTKYDTFGRPDLVQSAGDGTAEWYVDSFHAGREYDEYTGLYYNRARWYDPESARFLSEGANGQTNAYRYAGNSPTNRTDPGGEGSGEGGMIGFFDSHPNLRNWVAGMSDSTMYAGVGVVAVVGGVTIGPYAIAGGLTYAATSAVASTAQTCIEWGVASWMDSDYDFGTNFAKNFAFNYATGNIGGVWKTGGKIGMGVTARYASGIMGRAAAKRFGYAVGSMGTTYAGRKLAETSLDTLWDAGYHGDYNVARNFAFNLGVNIAGDAVFGVLGGGARLVRNSVSSRGARLTKLDDGIPATGVGALDSLASQSRSFAQKQAAIERLGYRVIEDATFTGRGEFDIDARTFTFNPETLTRLDLAHEWRHYKQLVRLKKRGLGFRSKGSAAAEVGAYRFEQRLWERIGVRPNDDYLSFYESQLSEYLSEMRSNERWLFYHSEHAKVYR